MRALAEHPFRVRDPQIAGDAPIALEGREDGRNDAVPNTHPLYVGPLGRAGAPEAAAACRRADLILAVGSRLAQFTTHFDDRYIRPGTPIVQLAGLSQAPATAACQVVVTAGQKRPSSGSSQGRAVGRRRALGDLRAAQGFCHLLSIRLQNIHDPPSCE